MPVTFSRLDPDRTAGMLDVTGDAALEFGTVALGGSATRTFTVRNLDAAATSQLTARARA